MNLNAARAALSLARDFAVSTDDDQRLGKPVPTGNLWVPNTIDLNPGKDSLLWVQKHGSKLVRPSTLVLFKRSPRLWQEPPEAILRYAKRWGLLSLDLKGTPCVKPFPP